MPDYDNSGILSKNERKTEDFHADYKGNATVAGVSYWLDAKVREKDGRKFMTLKFKPKDQPQERGKQTVVSGKWSDDDPPF